MYALRIEEERLIRLCSESLPVGRTNGSFPCGYDSLVFTRWEDQWVRTKAIRPMGPVIFDVMLVDDIHYGVDEHGSQAQTPSPNDFESLLQGSVDLQQDLVTKD